MTAARSLAPVAAALLALEITACTLDFDRFTPVDANAGPLFADAAIGADARSIGADAGSMEATAVDTPEASGDAAAPDGAADDSATAEAAAAEASCAPPASCLDTARTCGDGCVQQEKQCTSRCGGGACRSNCTRTESSCLTRCTSTCSTCVRSSGCGAASDCGDAAAGD